jgi:hypothetical protein
MRLRSDIPAPAGTRFGPHAFDGAVGREVPITGDGRARIGHGRIIAAVVALDGRSVTLTLDTDVELAMLGYDPTNPGDYTVVHQPGDQT